jgi:hypothetical protein
MRFNSLLRAALLAVLPLATGAASAAAFDGFDNGLAGWNFGGDVAVLAGASNPFAALTTASVAFDDDNGPVLNLSGNDPLLAGVPGGFEDFFGAPLGAFDRDLLQQATEGSALGRQFTVQAGDRFHFDWSLATNDTQPGFGLDFAFVMINGERFDLGRASDASLSGAGGFDKSTAWTSFDHVFTQGGTYTVAFGVVDVGDYVATTQLSLDNVTVSAVPEPGALALMAVGLGLVGVAARRRRA